jgi:hypothetical protein
LSPAFVAAAAAVDLENPVFSQRRQSLLVAIPETFVTVPDEPHPDTLTRQVIARLEVLNPAAESGAAEFLALLKSPDPVAEVRARVVAYRNRIAQRLDPNARADAREAELRRLLRLEIQRRITLREHAVFGALMESEALLSLP